jgi:hypothetical protein
MRKFFYFLGFLLLIAYLLWWLWIKPSLESKVYQSIKPFAPNLAEKDLEVIPFGLKLVEISPNSSPSFPLQIKEPSIRLSLLSLLTMSPQLNFAADILDAKFTGQLKTNSSFNTFSGKARINSAELTQHPILKLSGLSSGLFSAEAEFQLSPNSQIPDFSVSLEASELGVNKGQTIPAFVSKFPIFIPAFASGTLNFKFACQSALCSSQNLRFSSSLGEINGKLLMDLPTGTDKLKDKLDAEFIFSLTKSGKESILPLLGLVNRNIIDSQAQKISLKVTGPLHKPNVSVVAINQEG